MRAKKEVDQEWRSVDRPTDVLSFPMEDDGAALGDVVISVRTAMRQAPLERQKSGAKLLERKSRTIS